MASESGFIERLKKGEILLADGGWGTELQKRGLEVEGCGEEWNVSRPEQVKEIARAYFEAGAEMGLTNTFGGNKFRLRRKGLGERVEELNEAGARLSQQSAREFGAFVAGSVGPTGEFIEPAGLVTRREMYGAFHEQMAALRRGGVRAVVVETLYAPEEMRLAVQAARDLDLFCMATMTFEPTREGFKTITGQSVREATQALDDSPADVVGTNCGNGIEEMIRIVREMRRFTEKPILMQSNAGFPRRIGGELVYTEDPAFMAERIGELIGAGVNIIGGCCGTTPAHIKKFRETMDRLRR